MVVAGGRRGAAPRGRGAGDDDRARRAIAPPYVRPPIDGRCAATGRALRGGAAPTGAARFGRVLGQVQDTFIVAASDDEVFFLDQHAAHERVLFERLQADLAAGAAASQALLFPQPLELRAGARARPRALARRRSSASASRSRASAATRSCCARSPCC